MIKNILKFRKYSISFMLALLLILTGDVSAIERDIKIHHSNDNNTPVIISVMDNVSVKGEKIFLKDLAVINSGQDILKKIEEIEIGLSPMPGKEKIVSGRWILSQIQSKRFFPEHIKADIPDTVIVRRAYQKIPEENLLDMFYGFLDSEISEAGYRVSNFKINDIFIRF